MSVAVKTYLNFDNDPEIRRFAIDSDASTSYDYLVEKVRSVYPSLKRETFQLFWKDEDEEFITFSSDDELIEALTHVGGEFFRVYIKVNKPAGGSSRSSSEGEVHPHVTCDGCEGSVVGSRFKCVVCPDYDLCSTCEANGLHSQHILIRIRTPGGHPFLPWLMGAPWMRGGRVGPRGCGPRTGGPWRGPFPGARGARAGCPWFPRGREPREGPTPRSCGDPRAGRGEKSQEGQAGREGQERTGDEQAFFHQFGEVLNTFLSPFGVDVHTYVDDSQGEPGKCGQHSGEHSSTSATAGAEKEPATKDSNENNSNDEPMEESSSPDPSYVVVDGSERGRKSPDPDASLAEAIAKMKAMGFDDEGGWLSQLLKAKKYDINKVLDAIHHPQKKM